MASMTIRVRTNARMIRVPAAPSDTIGALKQRVCSEVRVDARSAALSTDPAGRERAPDAKTIASLRFRCARARGGRTRAIRVSCARDGQLLHLQGVVDGGATAPAPLGASLTLHRGEIVAASPAAPAAPPRELTADCAHGPRGACHHCCPGDKSGPSSPLNKAHRCARVCVSFVCLCLCVCVCANSLYAPAARQLHGRRRRRRGWCRWRRRRRRHGGGRR